MAKSKKYYVVWEGHEPGIYDSWAATQQQIKNYPNAKYKSFKTRLEADEAFHGNYHDFIGSQKKKVAAAASGLFEDEIIWDSIAVDAACSGNPGDMEYRGVDTKTGGEYFRVGPFKDGTNNVGEFLALVHALALFKQKGITKPIYSDSRIAMGWIKKKKCNTKLARTRRNAQIFDLIARAEKWLANNTFENEIYKWETKRWGEIPADFGRK